MRIVTVPCSRLRPESRHAAVVTVALRAPALSLAGCVIALVACTSSTDSKPSNVLTQSTPSPGHVVELQLLQPRAVHHATRLRDGRVLITGGCTLYGCGGFDDGRVSEFFDPRTQQFTRGPLMLDPRAGHTATLLTDGRVLLAGGYPGEGTPPTATAEVFDPATGEFLPAKAMTAPRADHTATALPDGRVLISGGVDYEGQALRTTEFFDPRTGAFDPGPVMSSPRNGHAAVLARNGVVLVGGVANGRVVATTDVLVDGAWTPGPQLHTPRVKHAAAALPDGRVLVVGGARSTEGRTLLASTEVIDVQNFSVRAGPALSQGEYKLTDAVVTLADGRVVIGGGERINVYDPVTDEIDVLASPRLPRRSFVTVTAIGKRTVLVAGGYDDTITPLDTAVVVGIPKHL